MARLSKKRGKPKRDHYTMKLSEKKAKKKQLRRQRNRKTTCDPMKQEWDIKKTVKQNMAEMGLVYDLNMVRYDNVVKQVEEATTSRSTDDDKDVDVKPDKKQARVIHGLQREKESAQAAQRAFRVSEPELLYCVRLLEKYGDDFQAMARDRQNHYQDTPKQIQRKIARFKNTPQYAGYLRAKNENREVILS